MATKPDTWVSFCLHDVLPETTASGGGPERFATPLAAFEGLLGVIEETGHVGCSLATAMELRGTPRVALTFDDATRSQFDFAIPALRARGMSATIYVVTDWIGAPGYMTWDELRQAQVWGMSIQSHSKSHPFLSELDEAELLWELAESKAILDRELAQNTLEIAFPGGNPPRRGLQRLLAETGYRTAVGTRWGLSQPPKTPTDFVRRCTVRGSVTREWSTRAVSGDTQMAASAFVRESILRTLRYLLGPSRYAAARRSVLDVASR